jgi:hypothetical protein
LRKLKSKIWEFSCYLEAAADCKTKIGKFFGPIEFEMVELEFFKLSYNQFKLFLKSFKKV